jgi:quinoprotein dehydrogenase-associated probable ABC transporter substrate-binding protein
MVLRSCARRLSSRLIALAALVAAATPFAAASALAQNMGSDFGAKGSDNMGSIELVDPKVLRVCADPNNLPFSNQAGQGFENKIASFLAQTLGKDLAFSYYPGASGFVRNTLNAHLCDVIVGMPQGNDLIQPSNPYYRTSYAIVTREGSELFGLASLDDPRLKEKPRRIGLVAGTPPATLLARNGLLASVKPYALMVDTRFESSSAAMIADLENREIDIAVLWGPIAGYYAKKSSAKLTVVPIADQKGAAMSFRIGFGVRHSDQNWKRDLNQFIAAHAPDLQKILLDYGVPLLDEDGHAILSPQ